MMKNRLVGSEKIDGRTVRTVIVETGLIPSAELEANALPVAPQPEVDAEKGTSPVQQTILHMVWQRLSILVSLLLLQSLSQFVLEAYEDLITANVVVPLFLTMLVGAGGNAGNQAAVHAITGLVTGEFKPHHLAPILAREMMVGLISSTCLFFITFVRVYVYYSNEDVQPTPVFVTVLSISISLFIIVITSVFLGCTLPFALRALRINVEHAAPMIQVVMDILGVTISCITCSLMLPSIKKTSPPTKLPG
jgi:Mg/Co/Ni transporter MgtE